MKIFSKIFLKYCFPANSHGLASAESHFRSVVVARNTLWMAWSAITFYSRLHNTISFVIRLYWKDRRPLCSSSIILLSYRADLFYYLLWPLLIVNWIKGHYSSLIVSRVMSILTLIIYNIFDSSICQLTLMEQYFSIFCLFLYFCRNGIILCWPGMLLIMEEWIPLALALIISGFQIFFCITSMQLLSTFTVKSANNTCFKGALSWAAHVREFTWHLEKVCLTISSERQKL